MNTRELKALEIAARMRLTFDNGTWTVPSQTSNVSYWVQFTPDGGTCTCEDWQLCRQDCKHIIASRLVAQRDGGPAAPAIDTEVVPKKKTYRQNWPAYNEAQINEKRRF